MDQGKRLVLAKGGEERMRENKQKRTGEEVAMMALKRLLCSFSQDG